MVYPGVYSPNSPGAVDVINGVGTWKDIISGKAIDPRYSRGKGSIRLWKDASGYRGRTAADCRWSGSSAPVGGELAAGIDKVLGTVGTVLNGEDVARWGR